MAPILSKIIQLVCSLSIIVLIHELGHFLPAKWFGCRVDKFYLFFDAWFSLAKKKIGNTVYGIGWIPLGGYVKIAGMIDESMDKDQLKKEPEAWEFRSKKPWQKIIVMGGGVFLNLVLGVLIFIGVSYFCGEEYLLNKNLKYGIHPNQEVGVIGLQNGDLITKVGDKSIDRYTSVFSEIMLTQAKYLTVERQGREVVLPIPSGFISSLSQSGHQKTPLLEPRFPLIIEGVEQKKQFRKGMLEKGDQIISFNDKELLFNDELMLMKRYFADSVVRLGVLRKGHKEIVEVQLDPSARLGVLLVPPTELLGTTKITYSFWQAIPVGIHKAYTTLANYLTGLKLLFTSKEMKVKDSLGGPISMGNLFPAQFSWQQFWILTAVISISIGIMNLLPIPALDGGHILFALYELLSGRKPSLKFQEYAQSTGMILLLGLMAYALGLDILRIFR